MFLQCLGEVAGSNAEYHFLFIFNEIIYIRHVILMKVKHVKNDCKYDDVALFDL